MSKRLQTMFIAESHCTLSCLCSKIVNNQMIKFLFAVANMIHFNTRCGKE